MAAQEYTDGAGFSFPNPISFQKWRLQKLPKHPPNRLCPSSTIGEALFTRSFTFSFKRAAGFLLPHMGPPVGWVASYGLVFSNPKLKKRMSLNQKGRQAVLLSTGYIQREVPITQKLSFTRPVKNICEHLHIYPHKPSHTLGHRCEGTPQINFQHHLVIHGGHSGHQDASLLPQKQTVH